MTWLWSEEHQGPPGPALQPGFGAHQLLSVAAPAPGMGPEQGAISEGNRLCQHQAGLSCVLAGLRQLPGMLMQQLRRSREGEDMLSLLMLCQLPSPSQANTPWEPPHSILQSWGWAFPALSAPQQLWMASGPVQSQLSLAKTFTDEAFPALPGGLWRRICVGRDTVSLGLAVKYQSLGWLQMPARTKPHLEPGCACSPCEPERRGEPSLPEQPRISELSALPWPVGAAVLASCSQSREREGLGTTLGDLDSKEDTTAPLALLFCRKHSPGKCRESFEQL